MKDRLLHILLCSGLLCALSLATFAAFAATEAGEEIINQAILTYIDADTGETVELLSNSSRVVVTELSQFELTASQSTSRLPGEAVAFAHTLQNTGNVDDVYSLSLINTLADSLDLDNLALYIDSNDNGVVDTGEELLESQLVALQPDETLSVIVTGIVPADAAAAAVIVVELAAESLADNTNRKTNQDEVSVSSPADLSLVLSNSPTCDVGVPDDQLIGYTVLAANGNDTLPAEQDHTVDGTAVRGVLIEVAVPSRLTIQKPSISGAVENSLQLVVRTATSGLQWIGVDSWDGSTPITHLAAILPATALGRNVENTFNFSAFLSASTSPDPLAPVELQALTDQDADGRAAVASNRVCNVSLPLAPAIEANLRFVKPTLGLQRAGEAPTFEINGHFDDSGYYVLDEEDDDYRVERDAVYIEMQAVISSSRPLSVENLARFVDVSVRSELTGDTARVVLREVPSLARANQLNGTATHIYRSIRPLSLRSDAMANGRWCPGGDVSPQFGDADFTGSNDACVLRSDYDDRLFVTFEDAANDISLNDVARVNPVSLVFDSTTLRGVEDALVTVYDGESIARHPLTDDELVFKTDELGRFVLPLLGEGDNYSIEVNPPDSYLFPSNVPVESFPELGVINASYGASGFANTGGGRFVVSADDTATVIDIPLDPAARETLLIIDKTTDTPILEIGDVANYRVVLRNQGESVLGDVTVVDTPPYGFRYIPGSAAVNGVMIADPIRLRSPDAMRSKENGFGIRSLFFNLDDIPESGESVLTYRMQAGVSSVQGTGINTATATASTISGLQVATGSSSAEVKVRQSGVLSDDAILFGKVYVDSSCDFIQNNGEWPIAGVRLYLQDGTYVVTDEDGQFSLFGLAPESHVLKIDTSTLPDGLDLKPLDVRHGADPESRFVNLSRGDFHRADFAVNCPKDNSEAIFEELAARNEDLRGTWLLDDAFKFNPDAASGGKGNRQPASDGDLSSGVIGNERLTITSNKSKPRAGLTGVQQVGGAPLQLEADVLPANRLATIATGRAENDNTDTSAKAALMASAKEAPSLVMADPKELVKIVTREQGKTGTWMWPESDISTDGRFLVVVRADVDPELYVNDELIPATQIGERIINRRENAQVVAWYGVQLEAGVNQLEVRTLDSFGNKRILAEREFKKPGAGVRLTLRAPQDTLPADDGRSMLPVDILVSDANGYPASGVYFVSLQTTAGDFLEPDLQPKEPGWQVRVENGEGRVHLRSGSQTGELRMQARTGALQAALDLVQVATSRPLIASGLAEAGARRNTVDANGDNRNTLDDGFDLESRLALFVKGRIKNDLALTLSYDTDKGNDTDLLRDVNPNEHYATYGDASSRGYEAQSRSKLFVKVERDRNSVMWGDYLTDSHTDTDDLARTQRTLTGANAVYDNSETRVQVFAAEQEDAREVEEIRGNGTSLLFRLQGAPIVPNSEVIELIVRDRDSPGIVIESQRLTRFTDYTLDSVTGEIRFSEVIPSVDAQLNLVFVRIGYDRRQNLKGHVVSGIRARHDLSDDTRIGVSLTDDRNPDTGYTIGGANIRTRVGLNTQITATSAWQRHRDGRNDGAAARVSVDHLWGARQDFRTVMSWARSTANFDNPTGGLAPGREEWRLEHRQPINNTTRAQVDVTHSSTLADDTTYTSAGVTLDKTIANWALSGGVRVVNNRDATRTLRFSTVLLGAERRISFGSGRSGSIGVEYEQATDDPERYRARIKTRVALAENVEGYASYEQEQGIAARTLAGDQEGTTQFAAGVETEMLPSTKVYSEYRMRGNLTGRNMETASGVRGRYEVQPGLSVSPTLEVIDVLAGEDSQDSIAASVGIDDIRNPNRKLSGQAEIRRTDSDRYLGMRASMAQRLSVDWTGLVREEYVRQSPNQGEITSRHQFTLGLAKRPKRSNKQHSLYLLNWKENYGPENGADQRTYLASTHQNHQVNKRWGMSGRLGAKWQRTRFDEGNARSRVLLADVRSTLDLRRRWELDLRAGWLGTGGRNGRVSVGAGVHWLADRNLRLGVAYNFLGFREDDLDEQRVNAQGLHLGLQLKFDEDWFRWLED